MKKYLVALLLVATFAFTATPALAQTQTQTIAQLNQQLITLLIQMIRQLQAQILVLQANNNPGNRAPSIGSATFDGNGIVIHGERLAGSYVAFTTIPPSAGFCREMITSGCVLQKTVSTDNTIKFISNLVGTEGLYQIYVENPTTGRSNTISVTIPVWEAYPNSTTTTAVGYNILRSEVISLKLSSAAGFRIQYPSSWSAVKVYRYVVPSETYPLPTGLTLMPPWISSQYSVDTIYIGTPGPSMDYDCSRATAAGNSRCVDSKIYMRTSSQDQRVLQIFDQVASSISQI